MIKWNEGTERLTDRAFMRLFAVSLLWIFLATAGLCSVTWAYYGATISVSTNTLAAGSYNAEQTVYAVTERMEGAEEGETLLAPHIVDGTICQYAFEKGTLYRVTVDLSESTSHGYCKIFADGLDVVYANMDTHDGTFEFFLRVSEDLSVSIETRWGIYSGESAFADGDTIMISVPAATSSQEG